MFHLWLSVVALGVSSISFVFFILSNYDKLSKHYLAWRHDCQVELGIRLPDSESQFVQCREIPYTDLPDFDGERMFTLAVKNSSDFDVELDITVAVGDEIMTAHEYYGAADHISSPYELRRSLGHPVKEYQYSTYTCHSGVYSTKEQFLLVLNPDDANVLVMASTIIEIRAEVYADVSNFRIPGTSINFPRNIGKTRFSPIHEEYEILGPDHEYYQES